MTFVALKKGVYVTHIRSLLKVTTMTFVTLKKRFI